MNFVRAAHFFCTFLCRCIAPTKALSTRIRIRLKTKLFSLFSKKFASNRNVFSSFPPVHTYTMNRFENDNLPDYAYLTHTCLLL